MSDPKFPSMRFFIITPNLHSGDPHTHTQGHCNSISCILVTDDRAIIITSDMGDGSLLVLWNSKTGNPIQSIVQPHKFGTVAMDLSPDDEWLVTVGAADPESGEQEVRKELRHTSHGRSKSIEGASGGEASTG